MDEKIQEALEKFAEESVKEYTQEETKEENTEAEITEDTSAEPEIQEEEKNRRTRYSGSRRNGCSSRGAGKEI